MTTFTQQFTNDTDGVDTFIQSNEADTNKDSLDALYVGESNIAAGIGRGLIKFDWSSISPPDIVISTATISLWIAGDLSDNARTFKIYRVLRNWVETQATWNNYSSGNSWTTAGCGSDGNDADLTNYLASCSFYATQYNGDQKDFVFTASGLVILQNMVRGTYPNYGFLIKADTENNDMHALAGSRNGSFSHPLLTFDYNFAPGANPVSVTPYMMV